MYHFLSYYTAHIKGHFTFFSVNVVVRILVSTNNRDFCQSVLNFDLRPMRVNAFSFKSQKTKTSVCSKLLELVENSCRDLENTK